MARASSAPSGEPQGPGQQTQGAGPEGDHGIGRRGRLGQASNPAQQTRHSVGVAQGMSEKQRKGNLGGKGQKTPKSIAPGIHHGAHRDARLKQREPGGDQGEHQNK